MVVAADGLRTEAKNLIDHVGSLEAVFKACDGWWLGVVVAVIREGGKEEKAKDHSIHGLQQKLEAKGKGRKRKKADGDKKGGSCAAPPLGIKVGQGDGGKEGDPAEVDGKEAGPVIKARVAWVANEYDKKLQCRLQLPMVRICPRGSQDGLSDIISREYFLYEEPAPHVIKWNGTRKMHQHSVKKLRDYLPKDLPTIVQGQGQGQVRDPAQLALGFNHAGVYVGTHEAPVGGKDKELFDATRDEILGFKWKIQEVEDPNATEYEVVALRRASGKLFAVVKTMDGDVQHDHILETIHYRIFKHGLGEGFTIRLPLMMQWPKFSRSILILDPQVVRANAQYYERIVG